MFLRLLPLSLSLALSLTALIPPRLQGREAGMRSNAGWRSQRSTGHPTRCASDAASAARPSPKAAFRRSSGGFACIAASAASVQARRAARATSTHRPRKSQQRVHRPMHAWRAMDPEGAVQARDPWLYTLSCRLLSLWWLSHWRVPSLHFGSRSIPFSLSLCTPCPPLSPSLPLSLCALPVYPRV